LYLAPQWGSSSITVKKEKTMSKYNLKRHFILLTIFLILQYSQFVHAECKSKIQVQYDHKNQLSKKLKIIDRSQNKLIYEETYNSLSAEIITEKPDLLYRTLDVKMSESNDKGVIMESELSYLHVWPCDTESKVTLMIRNRTGAASEVREMWESKPMISPPDTKTAAFYFANSLGTNLARIAARPDGNHQYDLISTYLVLRSFKIYSQMSNVPLLPSNQLRMIAGRMIKQLSKINTKELSVIEKEGPKLASEILYYQIFYKKVWNKISAQKDMKDKLLLMDRFYESVTSEADSAMILKALQLTKSEILASRNNMLGNYIQSSTREPLIMNKLLDKQISETQLYLNSDEKLGNRDKLIKDLSYFKKLSNKVF
jgi:hypothetical protein